MLTQFKSGQCGRFPAVDVDLVPVEYVVAMSLYIRRPFLYPGVLDINLLGKGVYDIFNF